MELNGFNDQKPIIYNGEDDFFSEKVASYAIDAGILNAVESFLTGLPDSVRSKMTAGELADHLLSVIRDLKMKQHNAKVKE